jgi:hypothetical protein
MPKEVTIEDLMHVSRKRALELGNEINTASHDTTRTKAQGIKAINHTVRTQIYADRHGTEN